MKTISGKINQIFSWRPGSLLTAFGAVFLLAIALAPLLRLALYAIPWYDDYNYGYFTKSFLNLEYSLPSAIQGAAYTTRTQWYIWQGTFASCFLMAMMPAAWGEQYYFLGPLFIILLLTASVWILSMTLLRTVLGAETCSAVTVSALSSCTVVMLVYTAQSGFYWYNAGIHYVGMHSFFMLLVAAWVKLWKKSGKTAAVFLILWSMIGAVLAGGANYVTALQAVLTGVFLLILGGILKNRRTLLLLPSMLILGISFYLNVSAPGNHYRSNIYKDMDYSMGALSAVWGSFVEAFRYIRIFSVMMPVIMVLLFPIVWKMLKGVRFRFRYPGVILLLSFCFYATGFTPSMYTLGHAGLSRTLNAVKITYQVLLILNEIYLLGWLQQKLYSTEGLKIRKWRWKTPEKKQAAIGCRWWFYPLIGILVLLVFSLTENKLGTYSSYGAYYYVHSGEAYNLRKEYEARVETIQNGGADVVVEPYHFKPWFLCSGDLSEDPTAEENRAVASWYGRESITCVDEETQ